MIQPKNLPETWPFLIVKPEVIITVSKTKNKKIKYRPTLKKQTLINLPDAPY